ncbi:WD40 repeat-like protein [Sodiomyces alkalinus F11]|uniref:WD40 repeat-like protein n=1 Tax=Sodiomyces alkalinus (strain CBS 110278 / VKM F-3762 / F11) TaxID=1314773 RepID=A0A3N2Q935_SODAK|nr:WD40 repeat-like protein [Sodiomyces alkalinus F11]ROT43158.1 WD40 repeat-like protein [Sodiomyces alkalinus F11]
MAGRGRHTGLASPPPSDGLLPPSSPVTMLAPSSPLRDGSPQTKRTRRERRKPVLTPRKLARFFTPKSQRGSEVGGRCILRDANDAILNIQSSPPASSKAALVVSSPLCVPTTTFTGDHAASPPSQARKRKRGREDRAPSTSPCRNRNATSTSTESRRHAYDFRSPTPTRRLRFESTGIERSDEEIRAEEYDGSHSEQLNIPAGDLMAEVNFLPPLSPLRLPSSNIRSGSQSTRCLFPERAIRPSEESDSEAPDSRISRSLKSMVSERDGQTPMKERTTKDLVSSNVWWESSNCSRTAATVADFFRQQRYADKEVKPQPPVIKQPVVPTSDKIIPGFMPKPVLRLENRGFGAQLLLREQGITPRPGRQHIEYPAHDGRAQTSKFFTRPIDVYTCYSEARGGYNATIPFCVESCHGEAITAIGDEEGCIRLVDNTPASGLGDLQTNSRKLKAFMPAHNNAIMDLSFSNDDLRLATACGDYNGKIIDVMSQSVAIELGGGHEHSMRRVAFQPGQANGNVVATSDRQGKIQLWDVRCSSGSALAFTTRTPSSYKYRDRSRSALVARPVNTLGSAHARTIDGCTRGASVTALQWMPAGREHLLLSACEANAGIKLWDTRYITPRNRPDAVPLAITAVPSSHKWRPFGITSLALGTDGSRLYAVCKDSAIYAYSTSHLILGQAPELSTRPPRQKAGSAKQGLDPLYCFRHPNLNVSSFYIRCSVRSRLIGNGPELLAVGSGDGAAFVFPTDESNMLETWDGEGHSKTNFREAVVEGGAAGAAVSRSTSGGRGESYAGIPTVINGARLGNGHSREVTGVSWTSEGKLVTISDDCTARHWQEEAAEDDLTGNQARDARELRLAGDFGGTRWRSGWAETRRHHDMERDSWDEDDDDTPLY